VRAIVAISKASIKRSVLHIQRNAAACGRRSCPASEHLLVWQSRVEVRALGQQIGCIKTVTVKLWAGFSG
jgi:hypothetical protein